MGLAPKIVDEIFDFLAQLAAGRRVSLLLVEQYVTRALELADYVYLLNRGQVAYRRRTRRSSEDEDVFARYLGTEVGAGH